MRCDACGSGDSLFVVVSGNSQGETRLCRVCALGKGYLSDEGVAALPQMDSILDQLDKMDTQVETEAHCPECGMSREQLVEAGRLGCPACVQAFRSQFLLARKRRGLPAGYAGKIPRGFVVGSPGLLTGLQGEATPETRQATTPVAAALEGSHLLADMESAVLAEDFETAALLRDRLGLTRINGRPENEI